MIYISTFVYTSFWAWVYSKSKKKSANISRKYTINFTRNTLFLLMVIPPIMVSGFRYGISVDYHKVYERIFNTFIYGGTTEGTEWGFSAITQFLCIFVHQSWCLFFFYSAITLVVFFASFNESRNYFISVILFFGVGIYFDSFNGIRQYIVVAIFAYAFKYIRRREIKKYMVVMGLSSLIHTSALITIPLWFLYKLQFDKKRIFVVLMTVFLLKNQLYNIAIAAIQLFPRYNLYLVRNTLANQISFSASGLAMAIIGIIPCLIVEDKMRLNIEGKFLYNMVMIGVIIAACSAFLPFAERILYYTRCYLIFAIPYACKLMNSTFKTKIWNIIICCTMCSMTTIGILVLNWYAVLPYMSIFSL